MLQRAFARRSRPFLALVVSSLAMLWLASSAGATASPGWMASHSEADQQAIVNYVYDTAPQGVVPYPGGPAATGQQIADMAAAAADGHEYPLLPEFADEQLDLLGRSRLLPPPGPEVPFLYPAAAGVAAFAAGWEIGTGLRAVFVKLWSPDNTSTGGSFTWDQLSWMPYGTEIYYGARVEQQPGAYLFHGWLNGTPFGPARWFEPPCAFSGYSGPAGARIENAVPSTARCVIPDTFPPEEAEILVDYPYLLQSDLRAMEPIRRYDQSRDGNPNAISPAPPDPGVAATRPDIEAALDGDGQDLQRAFIDWAREPDRQPEEDPRKTGAPPRVSDEDRPCVPSGSGPSADPGPSKPGTTGDPRSGVVSSFGGVRNPSTGKNVTVKLYWGDRTWGYRHIVIGHGWTAKDVADTALALQDRSPTINRATSWRYYHTYTGSDGKTQCYRRVVVEFAKNDPTFSAPKHIITSFAGAGSKR